jgi:hypothetical protein
MSFNKVRYPDFKPTPLSWLADKNQLKRTIKMAS